MNAAIYGVGYRPALPMGAALAEEICANLPPSPGPEWWLLVHLAWDADDTTRLTACGYSYMEQRTQAPRRTIYYWLRKLHDAGLVVTVSRSRSGGRGGAKGVRAVYEIQVPPRLAARIMERLDGLRGPSPPVVPPPRSEPA